MSDLVGQTVSHYKILEHLGGGGMGVVYKAQDLKLERLVALKFLPPDLTRDPEAKQRFVHEAKAASALDHQNICVVHDIGETDDGQIFIVMAFYEGETLQKKIERGPLKIKEAVDIAMQVAQGLTKAHEHGIIHRDIKPANVMLTSDGVAKIVDFGLAKLHGRSILTKTGSTLGTAAYMSPEQARGEPADHRTDIWSLGVVLYEMLTGRRPFENDYEQAVVYAILNAQPVPVTSLRPGIPMELERITNKMLAKNLEDRYKHVGELFVDLRGLVHELGSTVVPVLPVSRHRATGSSLWKSPPFIVPGIVVAIALIAAVVWLVRNSEKRTSIDKSIAVLPLNALGKKEDDQLFADGIHGEILTRLTWIKSMKVKAQTTVLQYRDTKKTIRQIGQELGVSYLLEGSVQKAGDRIRIQAQLIDAQSEDHIWAGTYEKPYGDIFLIQSEISEKIASELKVTLSPREQSLIKRKPTGNTEAYDYYLMGNQIWKVSQSKDEDVRAVELLEKAVELDSTFALAWAKLSVVECELMYYEQVRSPARMSRAKSAILKAEAVAPDLPEVHQAKGAYYYYADLDSARAFAEFQLALEDQPGNSEFLTVMGTLLACQGLEKEGLEYVLKAYELDPSVLLASFLSAAYFCLGRFADAERVSDGMIALEPGKAGSYYSKFRACLSGYGDLLRAQDVLAEAERNSQTRCTPWEIEIAVFAREFAVALTLCDADSSTDPLQKSLVFRYMGRHAEARAQARVARGMDARLAEQHPDWEEYHLRLATSYAILDQREDALREARRVIPRGMVTSNNNNRRLEIGAMKVYLLLGDYDTAINEIERLLSLPSALTKAVLRLDPIYDPLRKDPRFLALLTTDARK